MVYEKSEADDITAVSFTADQNEVEFDKKDDSWTEKSDANFAIRFFDKEKNR